MKISRSVLYDMAHCLNKNYYTGSWYKTARLTSVILTDLTLNTYIIKRVIETTIFVPPAGSAESNKISE